MNPVLKAFLIITGLMVLGAAIAVGVLHGMLARKNIPWLPTGKDIDEEDPTELSRQHSGIVMGRSRSGPGTAPLI